MPAEDSPAILVARFLRANDYTETLNAFLQEAGLPPDAGTGSSKALTIEQVLQEKKAYDLSVNFEKLGVEEKNTAWTRPAPSLAKTLQLPTATNLLCISGEKLLFCVGDAAPKEVLLVSTAERRLHMLVPEDGGGFEVMPPRLEVQDSPILSFTVLNHRYIICTCMSGRLVVYDSITGALVADRRDHSKYVVQVAQHALQDDTGVAYLATAGWDGKMNIYRASLAPGFQLGEPIARITFPTSPEALHFVLHPDDEDDDRIFLVVTRRDSSFLYYYEIPTSTSSSDIAELPLAGRQNLAPHSNAWVAFTPSAIVPHPKDATLLAVATSAVPHMKLLIVRLLFPSASQETRPASTSIPPTLPDPTASNTEGNLTAAQQARAALALQDREAAAISIHATTMAPQTQYSTPGLAWRPDGSGVWVNSDDGVIRGIETSTGKVVASLDGGHEAGSKVRCLWAGYVGAEGDGGRREVLVSGGFDQRLVAWGVA